MISVSDCWGKFMKSHSSWVSNENVMISTLKDADGNILSVTPNICNRSHKSPTGNWFVPHFRFDRNLYHIMVMHGLLCQMLDTDVYHLYDSWFMIVCY